MPSLTRHNPSAVDAPSGGYSMGVEGHRQLRFVSGQVPVHADGTVPGAPKRNASRPGAM